MLSVVHEPSRLEPFEPGGASSQLESLGAAASYLSYPSNHRNLLHHRQDPESWRLVNNTIYYAPDTGNNLSDTACVRGREGKGMRWGLGAG